MNQEIKDAESDPTPMGYAEFLMLAGCIHKFIGPDYLESIGFRAVRRGGRRRLVADSLIYVGDPNSLSPLSAPPRGMALGGYPDDDGRTDWRDEYVGNLRASRAIKTPTTPRSELRAFARRLLR